MQAVKGEAGPELRVAVEKATFAYGTVWANPAVAQSTQPDTTIGIAASDE